MVKDCGAFTLLYALEYDFGIIFLKGKYASISNFKNSYFLGEYNGKYSVITEEEMKLQN
jgi:hypothetical protein